MNRNVPDIILLHEVAGHRSVMLSIENNGASLQGLDRGADKKGLQVTAHGGSRLDARVVTVASYLNVNSTGDVGAEGVVMLDGEAVARHCFELYHLAAPHAPVRPVSLAAFPRASLAAAKEGAACACRGLRMQAQAPFVHVIR